MSVIKYIGIGIVLALILALCGEGYVVHEQSEKLGAANAQLKDLNAKVGEANKNIATQAKVAAVTDQVVTDTTKRIEENTDKGKAIKAVVDNVTKKVANENLSSVVAAPIYADSMWSAYCTAKQSDAACTSRQSSN